MLMRYTYSVRILLTEGAGLTSRQVATQLDHLGHEVSVAVSDPFCLARFTRHVRTCIGVPNYGAEPLVWFDHVLDSAARAHIDVLFPTQEQVAAVSHELPRLIEAGIATAVPPFTSLRAVQDKISALHTLERLGVPQPRTIVVQDPGAPASNWTSFPAYVKAPVGTGSTGVVRVTDATELGDAIGYFVAGGALDDGGVLVQEAVQGTFVMAQCVFANGSLVAFHANERILEGANGSAAAKTSLHAPLLRSELSRLGEALEWHGALSVDAIVAEGHPYVIDVNPRLVEPGNALAAGTDMVSALLAVAMGVPVVPTPPARVGVRTHQLLMAVLGVAQHSGTRRRVLGEVWRGIRHRGVYADSKEELLPWRGDCRTALLPVAVVLATLVRPRLWRFFTDGAVSHYALTASGWRQLRGEAVVTEVTPTSA
jgi:biotin carboxylase